MKKSGPVDFVSYRQVFSSPYVLFCQKIRKLRIIVTFESNLKTIITVIPKSNLVIYLLICSDICNENISISVCSFPEKAFSH